MVYYTLLSGRRPGHLGDEPAESNAQLVERTARTAEELGRPVATTGQAREILGVA
ncbi:MAG: 3-keto-5-aminohexanoate cleavage protein [Haloarculaceae archaeon]